MVYLYGIVHGGGITDLLFGHTRNIRVRPTQELIADLAKLPKGTKIGIENLSGADWKKVYDHLRHLPFNPPEPRFIEDSIDEKPFYDEDSASYWRVLEEECRRLGLNVVYIEDKEIWFRHNESIIKLAENNAKRRNLLVKERRESEEDYDKKRISLNHERHQDVTLTRKIHEIDRDNSLLKKIRDCGLSVVIVGLGHSEYWAANRETINAGFGVSFDRYSSEIPASDYSHWRGEVVFVKNAQPDLKEAFGRQSLERAVRLLEVGRITPRNPDFVGTWDVDNPCEGYFEMFTDKENGSFKGEIIDCLGDADFEGEKTETEIRFTKKYRKNRCSVSQDQEILYRGVMRGKIILGFYGIRGHGGNAIYMTSEQPASPVDLGISWVTAVKKYKPQIRSLGKRFFG